MKEHPIIFNAEMVRAILEGRKTQTRRPIKPQPVWDEINEIWIRKTRYTTNFLRDNKGPWEFLIKYCPFGQAGDKLWVRETWIYVTWTLSGTRGCYYKADKLNPEFAKTIKWRPSIHMPKWAARIWLEITGIRVERIQDISEEDAKAEGILPSDFVETKDGSPCYTNGFQKLWHSEYGIDNPKSWDSNPWIWIIEFEKL